MYANVKSSSDIQKIIPMQKPMRVIYKRPGRPAPITQADLAELVALRLQRQTVEKAIEDKVALIMYALQHGANIEPGVRTALIKQELIIA
jgi:hypothetical protein